MNVPIEGNFFYPMDLEDGDLLICRPMAHMKKRLVGDGNGVVNDYIAYLVTKGDYFEPPDGWEKPDKHKPPNWAYNLDNVKATKVFETKGIRAKSVRYFHHTECFSKENFSIVKKEG